MFGGSLMVPLKSSKFITINIDFVDMADEPLTRIGKLTAILRICGYTRF